LFPRRYPLGVKLIFHNSASVPNQPGTQFYAASQFGRGDTLIVPVHYSWGEIVRSSVLKRSIVVAGHKTSVSLEDAFWKSLKDIAGQRDMTLADLITSIDANRNQSNLSSAIRLFVLGVYRDQVR
jgi:predicted DNA-binding ribbon-helix-helix protein